MLLYNIIVRKGNTRRVISGYHDEEEAIREAQVIADNILAKGAKVEVETVTSPWYKPVGVSDKRKKNPKPKRAGATKRYMGHDYRKVAQGHWVVLPYGAKVASEDAAKAWIRQHVVASRPTRR